MDKNNLKQPETEESSRLKVLNKKKAIIRLTILGFTSAILLCSSLLAYYIFFYENYKLIKAFHNVHVEMNYHRQSHSEFNIKFKSKNFTMQHKFEEKNKNHKANHENNYFNTLIELMRGFSYDSKNSEFTMNKKHDFKIKIKELNSDVKKSHHHKTNKKFNSIECYQVSAKVIRAHQNVEQATACFNLEPNYWYGGHESYEQPYWPINNQSIDYKPYVTGFPNDWAAVLERYWLSSNGVAIFIGQEVPLHVKHTQNPNQICLTSNSSWSPYSNTPMAYQDDSLTYDLCTGPDIKTLHMYMINNYIGKPLSIPDERMFAQPIWTTWALFYKNVNQTLVLEMANQIVAHNYSRSNLEIDDQWEVKYGDLDFDKSKFPDMKSLSTSLHDLGFRVTLWTHPFCNIDSPNFLLGSNNGYWIKARGSNVPALTRWWDGNYCGMLDTTNPNATDYFLGKLNNLKQNYLVDGFKFDAGEAAFAPSVYQLYDEKSNPNKLSENYIRAAASTGNFIEIRTAVRTQDLGIFYRILDRSPSWTIVDGIKSVVTETLQFGFLGYPYVLPDIICEGCSTDFSVKELFIRWTQLTAFLPSMQFSIPPWTFDNETDKICLKWSKFHEFQVSPYMIKLASQLDGQPIIRPLWWVNATDEATFTIADQFIVGDEMVVAPVLDPGITSRDIYLPSGNWFDPTTNKTISGPVWLNNYPVVLESIPYFLLKNGFVISNYFKLNLNLL